MSKGKILLPLPDRDFDVTEVAVPWKRLKEGGYEVTFTTETGAPATCDPLLITGVIFGQLGAEPDAVGFYREMEEDPAFKAPLPWVDIIPEEYAGCWLPGGHAKGMKQLLEGEVFFEKLRAFWNLDNAARPVAAICHGVLVLGRAGLLQGVRTTCLPGYMERSAYFLTFWKHGKYYRTYPKYVETEVREACGDSFFERGPLNLFGNRHPKHAWHCEDGRYVSARWPGDAEILATRFLERLAVMGEG